MAAAFIGWPGLSGAFLLFAIVLLVLSARRLLALRAQRRILEAQQLTPGNLTTIVARHLPPRLRTNVASEEIPLVKRAIQEKYVFWRKAIISSAAATMLLAPAVGILAWHAIREAEARKALAELPPAVDVLAVVRGTWGWKYSALESCEKNPHTITLIDGQKSIAIRFKEPFWNGARSISGYAGEVTGTGRNELLLSLASIRADTGKPEDTEKLSFVFKDPNTYAVKRGNTPRGVTGDIVRCLQ